MKQDYRIITPHREIVYAVPGDRGPDDMRIYIQVNGTAFPPSLACIGADLRLKAMVEDRNYPPQDGNDGALKVLKYLSGCIFDRGILLSRLLEKHQIPEGPNRQIGWDAELIEPDTDFHWTYYIKARYQRRIMQSLLF